MSIDNYYVYTDLQDEINRIFGSRIKMLREEKGVSSADLAEVLGCTEEEYLGYEAGERLVNKEILLKMQDFY